MWTYESKVNVESKEMGDEKSTIKRYQGEQNVTSSMGKKPTRLKDSEQTHCFLKPTSELIVACESQPKVNAMEKQEDENISPIKTYQHSVELPVPTKFA